MVEPTETLGPYTLLRKIGAGGMGEVFLARDPKLDREVALKQLPAEVCRDPERRQRFLREARAAAKLAHPNITAIHDVSDVEGCEYIAFEYVEGATLEDVLRERSLELNELIDLALPLADALAYAHERGVIHRDLKAANVMVTSRGHAKLLDFGLAKILDEGNVETLRKSTTLTIEGAVFGTPQAMSPEQALGRSVDARSDVFSFGSLLYEMAAGVPAFRGETVMEVMDAVIHEAPPDLARLRPDLPAEFVAIVDKAMRKDPAERYPSIPGLVADLKHFKRKTESGLVPPGRERRSALPVFVLAAAVVVVVVVGAWFFFDRAESGGSEDASGANRTAGTGAIASAPGSIAVMGFELLGKRAGGADGVDIDRALTSLVTTALAEAGGIDVASSSKVLACLRGAGQTAGVAFDPGIASEAARAAGVELMVVGQVLARPSGLVLTAELVDVASGNARGSLRREVTSEEELFALAGGLAADVRARLGLADESDGTIDLARDLTDSPEAYLKFVAGEMALHEARFDDARRLLTQATEIDPSFAFAYLRLGLAIEWEGGPDAALVAYQKAQAHAERLPERWARLLDAVVVYARGDMDGAYANVEALIAAGHAIPEAYNTLGELLTHSTRRRDPERALDAFLRVLELDPNFQVVLYHVVQQSLELDRITVIDDVLDDLRRTSANPEGPVFLEIARDLARRDHAAAAARIEAAGRQASDTEAYEWCLTELGRFDEAERHLESLTPDPGSNRLRQKLAALANLALRQGRLREAARIYRESASTMALTGSGTAWYAANVTWSKVQAARTVLLLGSLEEALALVDEGLDVDPYGLLPLYWKTRWLVDADRREEADREVERMRAIAAECTSPHAPVWVALAEIEVALAAGEHARAATQLATLDDVPVGVRPAVETELVRARVARAAGDGPGEVAAWRAALHWARNEPSHEPDLVVHALYGLADAEERAGDDDAARAHGRELLAAWSASDEEFAMRTDARRRWGD